MSRRWRKTPRTRLGQFSQLPNKVRSQALLAMIDKLSDCQQSIIEANRQDMDAISKEIEPGAYRKALDRVRITEETIDSMIQDLQQLHDQPIPWERSLDCGVPPKACRSVEFAFPWACLPSFPIWDQASPCNPSPSV